MKLVEQKHTDFRAYSLKIRFFVLLESNPLTDQIVCNSLFMRIPDGWPYFLVDSSEKKYIYEYVERCWCVYS